VSGSGACFLRRLNLLTLVVEALVAFVDDIGGSRRPGAATAGAIGASSGIGASWPGPPGMLGNL
jgi:hypothetical protein